MGAPSTEDLCIPRAIKPIILRYYEFIDKDVTKVIDNIFDTMQIYSKCIFVKT
jgi:hypothetical protein